MYGIGHIEIPSTDLIESREFYSSVFNWKIEETGQDYLTFKTPDDQNGGFDKSQKPSHNGVLLYIEVGDIEGKLKEIELAGGKRLQEKTKISDEYGFYALFEDPSGNKLGIWAEE